MERGTRLEVKAGAGLCPSHPWRKRNVMEKNREEELRKLDSSESAAERERRVRELLSRMTLEEKVGQMSCSTPLYWQAVMVARYNYKTYDSGGNPRLGIPAIRFSDGPRGVTVGHSTCFPVALARGAAWDPALEERVGSAIGVEARARGANYFGGVCINLLRHPGWGRAQETFGEDPFLLGALGVAMIRGLQRHLMACAKHFACNSIEESRFFVDVKVDERTLREIYLFHFQRCVEAGVASVMSAYNQVNGRLCGHNPHLLRDILKRDWKFDGFVISDFVWGVKDTAAAANAGLDLEMPLVRFYGRKLYKAVRQGRVPEAAIDEAVTRILRQKDRFARVGDPAGYHRSQVACAEHTKLALEAARKSIVLLKNENAVLPLDRKKLKTLAVIGQLAKKANLGDVGSSRVRPPYTVTPLQGIRQKCGGAIKVVNGSGANLPEARRIAREADVVIVVAGLTWKEEGEFLPLPVVKFGGDRIDLRLPPGQEELIKAAAEENKRCIVVLEGGSAIITEAWKDKVAAMLMAWYPGMEGGNAIAEVLFGEVNPSGKLPILFPQSPEQLPHFDNRARQIEYGFYHGYRKFDKEGLEPAFPFGFGLSYTSYQYGNLRLSEESIGQSGKLIVRVDVTNVGDRAGEEVVQLYVGYHGSKVDRSVKELKGFCRVALQPGETKTVTLELRAQDLAYYNMNTNAWEVEEIEYTAWVGPSSRPEDLQLRETFRIAGA